MSKYQAEFDEESLIRIYVRLRNEEHRERNIQFAIYSKVLYNTNYRLPIESGGCIDRASTLKRIYADVSDAELQADKEAKMQQLSTRVTLRVVAPTTIVYFDVVTGQAISYEEYQRRYFEFLKKKSFVASVVPMLNVCLTRSSPVILQRCNKRQRLLQQEVV